jgi:hypothetical protein
MKRKFKFGEKVTFIDQSNLNPEWRNKNFCLLGYDELAFAFIEWERKGAYGFDYCSGNAEELLTIVK